MINVNQARLYCKEDISLIENYNEAIASIEKYDCHHRDELKTLPSGIIARRSYKDLKENDRYYNCHANELIFLKHSEHISLHAKYNNTLRTLSVATKKKIGAKSKGRKTTLGKTWQTSKFGKGFYEHYGLRRADNVKLYDKEKYLYYKLGKFSWEV